MTVSVKKIERECLHNRHCRESGDTRSILFDHEIWDEGVLVAEFSQFGPRRRDYRLQSPDGVAITRPLSSGTAYPVRAGAVSEFIPLYAELKKAGLIPSAEQIAARKAAAEERKANEAAAQKEKERIDRIRDAGPALLEALRLIEPSLNFSGWEDSQGEPIGDQINAAIEQALPRTSS